MKNSINAYIALSKTAQAAMLADICGRLNVEACGVLLGQRDKAGNWHVERSIPLPNIFNSPVYFEFAPEDLLAVELSYPGETIGVYHSHPTGFANASSTDRENMERVNQEQLIPWVWLIICGPFDEAFMKRAQGAIPYDSIIAYHHYQDAGLQRITLAPCNRYPELRQI